MTVAERQAGKLQGILLLLPITMAVMGLIVLVPVLPQIFEHFKDVEGVEYLVPLMLTLPALCVALLSPIAGVVVDFFGRRKTLIGSLIVYAIVGIMPIFLESLISIIISRAVLGAAEALVVISSTTLIGDYFHGREREKWIANQTAVASISSILLAFLGGALGGFGWRAAFAAYGVSILFAVFLMIWTWEPRKSDEPVDEAASGSRFPWGAIVPIALLAIFGGTMFFNMQIQVSSMLSDVYAISSPSALGMYSALAGLSVAVGTFVYRQFISRFPIPMQLATAFGLIGVAYVMMNHSATVNTFTVWLVVNQIGSGILVSAMAVWAMARLPFEFRGRGIGLFMSGWWLGQPISSQLVAFLRGQNDGNLPVTLQMLGITCLIAATIALVSRFRSSA
jgi:MFS family permease